MGTRWPLPIARPVPGRFRSIRRPAGSSNANPAVKARSSSLPHATSAAPGMAIYLCGTRCAGKPTWWMFAFTTSGTR